MLIYYFLYFGTLNTLVAGHAHCITANFFLAFDWNTNINEHFQSIVEYSVIISVNYIVEFLN